MYISFLLFFKVCQLLQDLCYLLWCAFYLFPVPKVEKGLHYEIMKKSKNNFVFFLKNILDIAKAPMDSNLVGYTQSKITIKSSLSFV